MVRSSDRDVFAPMASLGAARFNDSTAPELRDTVPVMAVCNQVWRNLSARVRFVSMRTDRDTLYRLHGTNEPASIEHGRIIGPYPSF